jgi:hypothetical protein
MIDRYGDSFQCSSRAFIAFSLCVVQLHSMHCSQFHDLWTQFHWLWPQLYDITLSTVGVDSYDIRDSQYSVVQQTLQALSNVWWQNIENFIGCSETKFDQ